MVIEMEWPRSPSGERDFLASIADTWEAQSILFRVKSHRILLVAYVFQPIDGLAVQLLLNGNVGHRGCRCSPMPMLLARWKPDNITGFDLINRASPSLHSPTACRHDQGLAQRVGVPRSPRTRLERDIGSNRACRIMRLEKGINTHYAGEPVGGAFAGRLRAAFLDFHVVNSVMPI